ncbi:MAG: hypothetical protein ABIR84_00495 [Candidatus Nitrotoga sp.]
MQCIERLQQDAKQIRDWLTEYKVVRKGSKGAIRKSNRITTNPRKWLYQKAS